VDRIQIQQVTMNLVRNAVEAMVDSPVKRIQLSLEPAGEDKVAIRVEDSGPGLPKEQVETLFQPMNSGKTKGMGLGLSISRAIVESHKGSIWVEPSRLGGAAFCFTVLRAGASGS
jgi:two-component system sensor kinase FixL